MRGANYLALVQLVCKGPIYVSNNYNKLSKWFRILVWHPWRLMENMGTNAGKWGPMGANESNGG